MYTGINILDRLCTCFVMSQGFETVQNSLCFTYFGLKSSLCEVKILGNNSIVYLQGDGMITSVLLKKVLSSNYLSADYKNLMRDLQANRVEDRKA